MNKKENKGGTLSNQQVEEELQRTGSDNSHRGSQDTGDDVVRELGTQVQREDGAGPEDAPGADDSQP